MKGWSSFVIAAVVTFGVTVAGTVRANWYVNAVPAATCKNIYGLPQLGSFGDLYTNSEFEPSGDTFYGGLTCYYQDHMADEATGTLNPPISSATLTVYDGDDRYDTWGLHRYDVRATLCIQDFYESFFWCSNTRTTEWTGWQTISFTGPGAGWSGDMPPIWNERGWGDPLVGFSKIIYVVMPQLSRFMGWNVGNSLYP